MRERDDRSERARRDLLDLVLSAVVMAGYWMAAAGVAGAGGLRAGGPVREREARDERA